MRLTMAQEVLRGLRCPYCGEISKLIDSKEVYGVSYGLMYRCDPCGAHVGVHPSSDRALGTLANDDLRKWRKVAHKLFDELWQRKISRRCCHQKARNKAYSWLSKTLGIPKELTHIGMFDEELCIRVVEVCKPYHDRYIERKRQENNSLN